MAEYRTGNHWGVTIVREAEDCDCRVDESSLNRLKFHQGCQAGAARLVAVVVNGDTALAERICDLLNEHGDEDLMTPGMPNPCQPIGCDNGIHLPGCAFEEADRG